MHTYGCHKCGKRSKESGSCPKCKAIMEKVCPVCEYVESFCTCTGITPQTKGPGPH